MKTKFNVRNLTVTAMLSAVAFVLMFVEFSIPIMPSFIKLDISDLPALLGAFSLGPVYGIVIELLKNLLHIAIKGTTSMGVGELSNFLLGAVFSSVAGLIYCTRKCKSRAVIGCIVGAVAMGLLSLPINYFIVYPIYIQVYASYGGWDMILGMYQAILPVIADTPTNNALLNCLLVFNVPFTACKGFLDVILCLLIYKPLSPILHKKSK